MKTSKKEKRAMKRKWKGEKLMGRRGNHRAKKRKKGKGETWHQAIRKKSKIGS